MSTRDREPGVAPGHEAAPRALPPGSPGAAHLATAAGNRAFARAVEVRQVPAPAVQRLLIPMAVVGAGLIYVSGEQRGWWGGEEVDAAAKTAGGEDRRVAITGQRAGNLRSRNTLNNQVFSVLDDLIRLVGPGTKEGATKARNNGQPLLGVIAGLAVGEGQRAELVAAQDSFGEAHQTAAALTETRTETIAMATTHFGSAATDITGVLNGPATPAPAAPAPAPATTPGSAPAPVPAPAGPPKPPVPPDVVASLKGVVGSLEQAQQDLAALGEKGEPDDVVAFTEEIQALLDGLSGNFVGQDATTIQTAGFKVRNAVRHLRAMRRSRSENGAHAADAYRRSRTHLEKVFSGLIEADRELEREEKALAAEKGTGEEGPPPKEGGG